MEPSEPNCSMRTNQPLVYATKPQTEATNMTDSTKHGLQGQLDLSTN